MKSASSIGDRLNTDTDISRSVMVTIIKEEGLLGGIFVER